MSPKQVFNPNFGIFGLIKVPLVPTGYTNPRCLGVIKEVAKQRLNYFAPH
jgi:hypothetical protein